MTTLLSRMRSMWRNLARRRRIETDLDAELQSYVQLLTDEKTAAGMDLQDARRAAVVELGGVEQVKEEVRDVKSGLLLDALWQDVRFGIRSMVKTPTLTAIAVFSLAIGIGVNASLFSLVDRLVLTTLPVRDAERLFIIYSNTRTGLTDRLSYPDLELIRSSFEIFDGVFGRMELPHVVDTGGGTTRVRAEIVTGNYFNVLGLRPALGRFITPEDDRPGSEFAIVVGHRFWRSALGGDPHVIGRTVRIGAALEPVVMSSVALRVVGVAPPEFAGMAIGEPPDIFLPLQALPAMHDWAAQNLKRPNFYALHLMARLKPGVTAERAQAELWNRFPNFDMVARGSSPDGGRVIDGHTRKLRLRDGKYGYSAIRDEYTYSLVLLMTLVAVVLVIASANLANLLLVRATARIREIGARLALGASPGRLVRQWFTESLLLSAIGGILGIAIAFVSTGLLLTFIPEENHAYLAFELNARNLAFTALVTIATGLLFGVLPAIRVSRVPLNAVFAGASNRGIGGRREWLTRSVVVLQIAVSLVLVTGAGLFARTLSKLNAETGGFDRRDLAYADITGLQQYQAAKAGAILTEVLDRLNTSPEVSVASAVSTLPIRNRPLWAPAIVPGYVPRSDEPTTVYFLTVAPRYFRTMGIRLLAGRDFEETDRAARPNVVIVNQGFATRFFKGRDPIGQTFRIAGPFGDLRIIGIAQDTRLTDFREPDREVVYYPAGPNFLGTIVVRSKPGFAAGAAIRNAVAASDKNLQVTIDEMEAVVQTSLSRDRLVAELSAGLGVLGLILACIGLYGVMAYAVSSRTPEIGIRMATGAQRFDILRMVLKETIGLAVVGIAIGLPISLVATRLLEAQLFAISPSDPLTVGFSIAVIMLVALVAGYLPARRAARLDPVRALRYE